ncbi:hypothetical protein [Streptomyces sp. NPDC094437]|uniref:hypothetical protein n=1 Tax=Streptomyces sp. NPDC094437 TaxID=3366060 RepID=UPI003810F43D
MPTFPGVPTLPTFPGVPTLPVLPAFPSGSFPGAADVPSFPTVPGVPEEPSLPGLPDLPVLPGVSVVPGGTVPVAQPGDDGGASADGHGNPATGGAATLTPARYVSGVAFGPVFVDGGHHVHRGVHKGGRRTGVVGRAPVRQAPGGEPDGALVSHSAVDGGGSRHQHGDACAVVLHHQAPLPLVRGASARECAAEIQDRYRDIPVSPA